MEKKIRPWVKIGLTIVAATTTAVVARVAYRPYSKYTVKFDLSKLS